MAKGRKGKKSKASKATAERAAYNAAKAEYHRAGRALAKKTGRKPRK